MLNVNFEMSVELKSYFTYPATTVITLGTAFAVRILPKRSAHFYPVKNFAVRFGKRQRTSQFCAVRNM
jgi:hypothetical protein